MIASLLVIVAVALNGHSTPKVVRVDKIEINRTPTFGQVIFWEWNEMDARMQVRGFIVINEALPCDRVLITSRGVLARGWHIEGPVVHTQTIHDPEFFDRDTLPMDRRNRMPWKY